MFVWPQLVQAALQARDLALAERMLTPVESAAPGIVSAAVAAQWHLLRGFTAALRGDRADEVERELRAGLDALDAFGAVGLLARGQESVARWLIDQGRPGDASPLMESARASYAQIGAVGWLQQLDSWERSRLGASQT